MRSWLTCTRNLSNKRKRHVIGVGMKHLPQFMVYSLSFIVIRYLNDRVMWCFNITASLSHLLQQLNDGNSCNKFYSGFCLVWFEYRHITHFLLCINLLSKYCLNMFFLKAQHLYNYIVITFMAVNKNIEILYELLLKDNGLLPTSILWQKNCIFIEKNMTLGWIYGICDNVWNL